LIDNSETNIGHTANEAVRRAQTMTLGFALRLPEEQEPPPPPEEVPGKPGYAPEDPGTAVDENGNPVLIDTEGNQVPVNAEGVPLDDRPILGTQVDEAGSAENDSLN